MLGVGFRGFRSVMLGMHSVAVCCHCMVRSLFSRSGFVVFGRLVVVFRGRLMMLGCALMMLCNFGCGSSHRIFLLNSSNVRANPATFRNQHEAGLDYALYIISVGFGNGCSE
jgi:hypothetical protein